MTAAQELERLVVRIIGDGSHYTKTLDKAVKDTTAAIGKINRATGKAVSITPRVAPKPTRVPGVGKAAMGGTSFAALTADLPKVTAATKTHTKAVKEATAVIAPAAAVQAAHTTAIKAVTTPINAARDATGRFTKTLKDNGAAHTSGGKAARSHGGALGWFSNMVSAAGRSIQGVGSRLKTAGAAMGIMGTVMAISVTLPIVGASLALVKLAADAETTRNQFAVMLGADQGANMLANIRKMGAETPFEFPELAASAKTLVGFGTAQEKVLPTLKMLGDVSAGTGKDIKELSVIFGQIQGMGRLQGQDFLQLVNAGFPVGEIAKTIGTDMAGLKDAMEDGLVSSDVVAETFRRLTSEGGQFHNMMEVLSKTATGKFSTLMDAVKETGMALGSYLLPTIKNVLDWLIAATTWFKNLSEATHKTVMFVVALVGGVAPLIMALGTVVTVLGFLGTGFVAMFVAGLQVVAIMAAIAAGVYLMVKGLQMAVDAIYGEGSFAAAIKGAMMSVWEFTMKMVGFLVNIGTNWKLLTQWLSDNWGNMLRDLGALWWAGFQNMLKNVVTIIHTMVRLWTFWQGFMSGLFKQLFTAEFVDFVLTGVINAIGILVRFVEGAWNALKNLFTGGGADGLGALATELGTQLSGDFKAGMEGDLLAGAGKILKEQAGALNNPYEGFKSSMTELPDFATEIVSPAVAVEKEAKKTAPEIKVMALKKKEEKKKKEKEEEEVKTGEFKQMSLKQFGIKTIGLNNSTVKKKQEVTDAGVQSKLDEVVGAIKGGQGQPAVMGR